MRGEREKPVSHTIRLLIIVLLALALRLALWAQPLHQPANDETEYVQVAYDLLHGRGWEFYTHYHWLRAPLYPLFLASSLWLFRGNLHLAALPNILLSVATIPLIFILTMMLTAGADGEEQAADRRGTANVAALLAALLFTFNTFASLYMSETLFSFLFTASLVLLVWWQRRGTTSTGRGAALLLPLAGIAYGLATLTRSVSLAFLPIVLVWMVVSAWRARAPGGDTQRQGWRVVTCVWHPLIFAVCVFLTIAPWTVRNCRTYGRCILVETGLSYNLWAFSEPHEDTGEIFRVLESIPNPAERADEATRRGVARLREDPSILLRKPWPNWVALWRIKPIEDRFLLASYYNDPPPLVFLGALLLDDALYVGLLVAGVVGIYHALQQRQRHWSSLLLLAWIAYVAGTTMLTHGEGRYRHFFFPLLIACAAIGLRRVQCAKFPLRPAHHPVQQGVATALLLLLLSTVAMSYDWAWAGGGALRSVYRLAGDAARMAGVVGVAESAYQQAYAAQPTQDGRLLLGDLALQRGDLARAEQMYRAGWRMQRRSVAASARLGDVLRRMGRADEARTAFAGYFTAEQDVTNWSWTYLEPPPASRVDVGNGLDFGYVGGVYNAEEQQGADARWTNGQGLLRIGGGEQREERYLVRLRMAAPHPGTQPVPVQLCTAGQCQSLELSPTWHVLTLLIPATSDPLQVVEIRSPTFVAPDGRSLGVLLDWVTIVSQP